MSAGMSAIHKCTGGKGHCGKKKKKKGKEGEEVDLEDMHPQ